MTGWQPIATAPKDGTTIDLWDGKLKYRIVNARWAYHYWMDGKPTGNKSWGRGGRDGPFCMNVTHWRPVPGPPEDGE